MSWCSANHKKSIQPPKTPVRPDISAPLAEFQRLWPDMSDLSAFFELTKHIRLLGRIPEAFPRHVRPPARTCPT
jgi:hypothetical protein